MISCKEYTDLKKKELKAYIKENNLHPKLVVVQVGNRPESNSYIRGKMRDCEEVGIECVVSHWEEGISQCLLSGVIDVFNDDEDVHGIIVQLPLPKHINVKEIQEKIDPKKDVDGFCKLSPFDPCTPKGVIDYLKFIGYEFEGKDALVIGRSPIVGKPLARMLTDLDCTVTLAHSKTDITSLYHQSHNSDIVFTCIDKIEYFSSQLLYNGADLIDIGLGIGEDGKLHGNLHEDARTFIKNWYPDNIYISGTGGVGLLTRLALVENVVKACEMRKGE